MQRTTKTNTMSKNNCNDEEEDQEANQEAIDRCMATEIAREDVESKLLSEAVTPETKRRTRPTTNNTLAQEYRMLREIQKREVSGETSSPSKKTDERRATQNQQRKPAPRRSSLPNNPVRANVSPFTFAAPTHTTSQRRYNYPGNDDEVSDLTSAHIAAPRPRSHLRRRRHEYYRPSGDRANAGHNTVRQDKSLAREVAVSLAFPDDEIEEVKARARKAPNWATAVARRPSPPQEEPKPTAPCRKGLHPSIRLNMGQNQTDSNLKTGEEEYELEDAKMDAARPKATNVTADSLGSTSAHAPASKRVWVTKRQRRQSTGSCRPVHIAESLFCDGVDVKISKESVVETPSALKRRITGSLLQCSDDSASNLSDIDPESVDYDGSDNEDSAYAMAMARTHLERKLAKEAGGIVDEKVSAGRRASARGSQASSSGEGNVETDLPPSQPGAFAVQGLRNEDSFSQDSLSLNMSSYPEQGLAIAEPDTGAVVDAEVFEDVVVDGSVLLEEGVVDQKTKKRLRAMQLMILCLTLGSIALVTGSIVDFTPNNEEEKRLVEGWVSIGDAIFGSADEPQTLFGSSVLLNQDSTRLIATSPGSDDGTNLNVGKVYVLDRSGIDGDETWSISSILEGSGQSFDAAMSLAASESTNVLAVGYPRLESGSFVEVFVETAEAPSGWEVNSQFRAKELGINERSWFGHSLELSSNGTTLSISAPLQEVNGESVGAVHIFKEGTDGRWLPKGEPIFGQSENEFFGWSMDLSDDGDVLAVGAPVVEDSRGTVRVYRWSGEVWTQLGANLEGEQPYNRFGESVSLSHEGPLLAVGSRGLAIEPGQAQLYRLNDRNEWDLEQSFVGQEAGEEFGSSVDLSHDGLVLAVGAPQSNYFGQAAGRLEVHRRNDQNGNWELQGSPIGSATSQNFGAAVALSGNGLSVAGGAPGTAFDESVIRAGSVHIFERQ